MLVINQNQPRIPTQITASIKKGYFPWKISEDHPLFVRFVYHFILTGNTRCFLSISLIFESSIKDLDFLDILLPMDDGKIGLEMISFLENIKDNPYCLQQPFMMVYVKCVFSQCKCVSEKAVEKFYIFCDIPKKLFLFMTISAKMLSANKTPAHVQSRSLASDIEKPTTGDELRTRRLARFNTAPNEPVNQLLQTETIDNNSMLTDTQSGQEKKCTLDLDDEKLKKCFKNFLDSIVPELLLLFLTQDKKSERTEEFGYLNFQYLLDHLNPELSENNKDPELKNLVLVFYSKGIESFREAADTYVEKNPFLGSSANVIFTCILEYVTLDCNNLENFILKHEKCSIGARADIKKENMKYFEQEDEYSIEVDNYLHLTFKHIPKRLLQNPKVLL